MQSNAKQSATTPQRTVRVLVVKNDQPTDHALALLLKHHRYEMISTKTMANALSKLRGVPAPDAVLLDLMLPDNDSVRVLETARSQKLTSQVTIVTSIGDPDRIDRALKLKPRALLQKPVDFPQILKELPPVG